MYLFVVLGFFAAFITFMKIGSNDFGIKSGNPEPKGPKTFWSKNYKFIMETIAILSFFLLVITFFFRGKNDFGLKPKSRNK